MLHNYVWPWTLGNSNVTSKPLTTASQFAANLVLTCDPGHFKSDSANLSRIHFDNQSIKIYSTVRGTFGVDGRSSKFGFAVRCGIRLFKFLDIGTARRQCLPLSHVRRNAQSVPAIEDFPRQRLDGDSSQTQYPSNVAASLGLRLRSWALR